MTRMTRISFAAAILVIALAGCGRSVPRLQLAALDDPTSTQTTDSTLEQRFDAAATTSTTAASASTTSTSQQRSATPGSPLPSPTSVPSTQTAPTTSTTAGAPLSAAGGHVEPTTPEGWRSLDGSCTITDAASGEAFGFTRDPACMDPITRSIPESMWPRTVTSTP